MSSFEDTAATGSPPETLPAVIPEIPPVVVPEEESSDALIRRTVCTSKARTEAFNQLIDMHRYMRPAFSKIDRRFIHDFIQPTGAIPDKFGNYYLAIGEAPIMWSSHTDTVHHKKGFQIVGFDKMELGIASSDKSGSNCLGADDTVGVWLMLQMIEAKVPGLYIFHRAEERGRKGSQYIAMEHGDLLGKVKYCIALDRREKKSVITHQSSLRTCSDAFGKSMIEQLDMGYELDTTGSYTDSFSYMDVISECTNISVGYTGAHTSDERQDLEFAFKLRDKLVAFDWTKLVSERTPGTKEYKTYHYESSNHHHHNGSNRSYGGTVYSDNFANEWGLLDDDTWVQNEQGTYVRRESYFLGKGNGKAKTGTKSGKQVGVGVGAAKQLVDGQKVQLAALKAKEKEANDEDDLDHEPDLALFTKLVERNPEAVAEILVQMGVTYTDLQNEVMEIYGVVNC